MLTKSAPCLLLTTCYRTTQSTPPGITLWQHRNTRSLPPSD